MAGSIAPWINDPTQMSPSLNLGLSLLANSNTPGGFGSIFGRSALQAGQNYQQSQLVQQQIEQARLQQQIAQQKMGLMQQFMGGDPQQAPQAAPQGQQAPGAQPPWVPQGSHQVPPQQSDPQQTQAPQGPGLFDAPSPQDVASIPIGGQNARSAIGYQVFGENKGLLEAYQNVHKQQLELAKEQYAPKLQTLSYLAKNDTPTKFIKADQRLMAAWPQLAAQAGLDPEKDFTDEGVRHAMTFAHNQIAASIGATPLPETNRLITKTLQDGRTVQEDPITGKQTIESASDLEKVIDPKTRQPILVPKGKAAGMEPFNQSIYGTAQLGGPGGDVLAELETRGVHMSGRTQQERVAIANKLVQNNPDKTPGEIADMVRTGQLDFNGAKRSTGQLMVQAAAANVQASKLEKDFAQIEPLVAKLPNAPNVINRTLVGLKNDLSFGGDKDSAKLVLYMREAATEYAKLSSGSTGAAAPAEGNIKDAVGIFQKAFTEGGYQGLKEAMIQSAQNKRDAVQEGLKAASRRGASTGETPTETPKAGAAPSAGWGAVVVHK